MNYCHRNYELTMVVFPTIQVCGIINELIDL